MTVLADLFDITVARSGPFDDHDPGSIAFVTNGYRDNGVLGYVTPSEIDRVFDTPALCVSAFCEVTVQAPPFIGRGNGGSGLTILTPKTGMSPAELWAFAGYLGSRHGWKFTFGRMATKGRLQGLEMPLHAPHATAPDPATLLPRASGSKPKVTVPPLHFRRLPVAQLFEVASGDFHSAEELDDGTVPLISCGEQDNGIIGFYDPPSEAIYRDRLTIAYNGDYPLMAKFHPYAFAAKDDVAILHPRQPLSLTTLLFVQLLFNRETWRHSYGRKLYRARLEKFEMLLPVDPNGEVDEGGIKARIQAHPLWGEIGRALEAGLPRVRRETLSLLSTTVR